MGDEVSDSGLCAGGRAGRNGGKQWTQFLVFFSFPFGVFFEWNDFFVCFVLIFLYCSLGDLCLCLLLFFWSVAKIEKTEF